MAHRTTFFVLLLSPVLGCTNAEAPVTSAPPSAAATPAAAPGSADAPQSTPASEAASTPTSARSIVVVGDATAADVVAKLREAKVDVTDDKSQIASARLIVVAQDAPQGLTPVHKKLAPEIARNRQGKVLWILTNTAKLDDAELMALFEIEIRELMSSHDYPGDSIQLALDTETTSLPPQSSSLKGWPAILAFVSGKTDGE